MYRAGWRASKIPASSGALARTKLGTMTAPKTAHTKNCLDLETEPPADEIGGAMQRSNKPNPYCSFKSDRERRLALLARDVRLVLIAFVTGGGVFTVGRFFGLWS